MSVVSNASSLASSTTPSMVCTPPLRSMITIAGWAGTPNREKTAPGLSLTCGKVSEYLSTKPRNELSSPYHATPTNWTLPAHFLFASSTEGASWLHVLQVGAQNHSATGLPASERKSN